MLKPYQEIGVQFLLRNQRGLLADEMGLGKTIQVLHACASLTGVKNILYLCPASLCLNVEREVKKWFPDAVVVQIKNNKSEVKLSGDLRFVVASYNYIQKENQVERLLKLKWHAIVADESHMLKNWTTKTCKGFRKLCKAHTGRVWMLTGTPATNSGRDYYPFLEICQPGSWGTLTEFQEMFCNSEIDYWSGHKKYTGVNEAKKPVLRRAFEKIALRRRLKEVEKELPIAIVKNLPVKVEGVGKRFTTEEVMEMFATGKVTEEGKRELQMVGLAKVTAAVDYLLDVDEQIVVFCTHTKVLQNIQAALEYNGHRTVTVTGLDSRDDKDRAVQEFASGKVRYILCNIQAGGVGIDGLQIASHMLIVELPYSPAAIDQGIARIIRIGQKAKKVKVTKLIGHGTIDERVLEVLAIKSKFMREVLKDDLWVQEKKDS